MISTNDIYFEMDISLVFQNFRGLGIEEKKKLIDKELRKYILSKIEELYGAESIKEISKENLSVNDLLNILVSNIPQDQHFEIVGHFTHYILQIVGNLQNFSITWWIEEEEKLIECPVLEIDENEFWTELKTHQNTDYVKTFNFIYNVFINDFMFKKKKLVKKIII